MISISSTTCNKYGYEEAFYDLDTGTLESATYCHCCHYQWNIFVKEKYWALKNQLETVPYSGKWYEIEQGTPIGVGQVVFKNGNGWTCDFYNTDEIESYKEEFQKLFKANSEIFELGKNHIREFKEDKFIITDVESLSVKEYLPEEFFKGFEKDSFDGSPQLLYPPYTSEKEIARTLFTCSLSRPEKSIRVQ